MDESTTLFLALPSHDSPTCSFWWRSKPSRFCTIWKLFSFEFVIKQRTHVIDSAGARESWSSIVCVCVCELLAQLPEFCSFFCAHSLRFHKNEHPNVLFHCVEPLVSCTTKLFLVKIIFYYFRSVPNPSDGAWQFYMLVYLLHVPPQLLLFFFFRRFFMFSRPSGGAEKKFKLKSRGSCDSFRAFDCNLVVVIRLPLLTDHYRRRWIGNRQNTSSCSRLLFFHSLSVTLHHPPSGVMKGTAEESSREV